MQHNPVDFVFHLAEQVQVLVCIAWLGKTQVLACIPPSDLAAIEDVAETTGVSVNKLARVVRLVSTAGFLREERPGLVAHTTLSLEFFEQPTLMDAVLFLSDTMAPAALRMCDETATKSSHRAISLPQDQHPGLRRQMDAFHRLELSRLEAGIVKSLLSLDWQTLGQGTVVQVGPPSPLLAVALSERVPRLNFIVQLKDQCAQPRLVDSARARIELQYRQEGQPQPITNADIYILHLPATMMVSNTPSSKANIRLELQVHFDLLRSNEKASLIIVAPVLPNFGDSIPKDESRVRLHDLTLLQLANEEAMNIAELESLISSVGDANGSFGILSRLASASCQCTVAILELQIEPKHAQY